MSIKDDTDPKLPKLRNPPVLEAAEDLTSLSYLNEPAGMFFPLPKTKSET